MGDARPFQVLAGRAVCARRPPRRRRSRPLGQRPGHVEGGDADGRAHLHHTRRPGGRHQELDSRPVAGTTIGMPSRSPWRSMSASTRIGRGPQPVQIALDRVGEDHAVEARWSAGSHPLAVGDEAAGPQRRRRFGRSEALGAGLETRWPHRARAPARSPGWRPRRARGRPPRARWPPRRPERAGHARAPSRAGDRQRVDVPGADRHRRGQPARRAGAATVGPAGGWQPRHGEAQEAARQAIRDRGGKPATIPTAPSRSATRQI